MTWLVLTALLLGMVAGCRHPEGQANQTHRKPLQVFAAASLAGVLDEAAQQVEQTHPGVDVQCQYAASSTLRTQIEQGATADVFASADATHPAKLAAQGLAETPATFARTRLVLITPARGDNRVQSPLDLAHPGVRLVTTPETVPLGRYTRQVLERLQREEHYPPDYRARVLNNIASEDANARTVRSRIELGAADAAFVYEADAQRTQNIRIIPLPETANVSVEYQVAVVSGSRERDTAREFVAFLLSDAGQAIFRQHGFRQ